MRISFQNVKIICPKILIAKTSITELRKQIKDYPKEIIIPSDVNKILTINSKVIKYNPVWETVGWPPAATGEKILSIPCRLKLKILEKSGNYLVHKNVLSHHLSKRQGTVSTKTRSEVKGGGRKPWKQKGTGRARAGSNCSPLWKGGGVIFGPKSRIKKHKLNKKEHRLALQTLLYNKKDNILVINYLEESIKIAKTKDFYKICKNCNINLNQKVLLVVAYKTMALELSVRNIRNIDIISSEELNILSLIKAKQIVLTPLALAKINNFNIINNATKRGGSLRIMFNNNKYRVNEFINEFSEIMNDHGSADQILRLFQGGFL